MGGHGIACRTDGTRGAWLARASVASHGIQMEPMRNCQGALEGTAQHSTAPWTGQAQAGTVQQMQWS
jgi:hypothetical protein